MKALLDSCILIDFLNGVAEARRELMRYRRPAVSVLSRVEVLAGTANDDEETAARRLLAWCETVPLTEEIADAAAGLRRTRRLRLAHAVILATARTTDRLLVSRDLKAFPADEPGVRMPYRL